MAPANDAPADTTSPLDGQENAPLVNAASRGNYRGGQGGFRGGQQRGSRGPRRNGRGRGDYSNRGNNQRQRGASTVQNRPAPPLPPPPGLGGGGSFGGRLTKDAETNEGEGVTKKADGEEEGDEAEVCFICASTVVHHSVAPCNHRTCHICALRLRALYKNRACAHCRAEAKYVIFTDDPAKRFEDFEESNFGMVDDTLGVKYDNKDIQSDTLLLLRYNCPETSCDVACYGWPDLHRHVKSEHHKVMCDLCTRNKKLFTHEHELFTPQELRKHEKFGDDIPGAVNQTGFKGHPDCGFCRQHFYGDDELYYHCRDRHEKCYLCEQREQGRQLQYFLDYDALALHFRIDHFPCADQECLDKKFVVFDSEIDLKAHYLEVHPHGLSKDARRDARRVDLSTFDYRTPHQEVRRGRGDRDGRSRGRGRDPNTEALPQSTAQPLRRDELAYQRQMAIQSAQSVTTRTFGGQLTSADASAAPPRRNQQEPRAVTAPPGPADTSLPPIDNLRLESAASTNVQLTPQEQARRLQHASVTDRASTLLKNDQTKVTTFRNTVSSYKSSKITATKLVDTFFGLFDAPTSDVGKLIKELADIYEDEAKRNDLLKAWNDWRAINEDYPTLPGPSGVMSGSSTSAGGGGNRVLRLKNSTAQSSRSAVSREGSWGNSAKTSNNSSSVPAVSASLNRAGAGRVAATPWITPSAAPARPANPVQPGPVSRPSQATTTDTSSAFPALPAAPKPSTLMAGRTRGTVRWDDGRSNNQAPNPWGSGTRTQSPSPSADVGNENQSGVDDDEGFEPVPRRKGAKAKKQTLYKFG